ncbi:MAG TPA: hypothetical protein VIK80_08560 [Flavihumibacter sp.]
MTNENHSHIKYLLLIFLMVGCIANRPTERIEFEANDLYPEGIAYDSTAGVYYVSSMRSGTIGKVDRSGNYSPVHEDSTLKSSYGMKLHPDGKTLYVMVGDANYSRYTSPDTRKKMIRLIALDLASGQRTRDIDLSGLVPGEHFGNDLIFDRNGNIYITDSYAHAIYKVDPSGSPSVFVQDSLFATKGFGVNGIVYHPDNFLLVSNSNTGQIYKVNIDPVQVQAVKTDQFFLGADGLLLDDPNQLIIVTNGGNDKIFQIKTEDGWGSAKLNATTLLADRFTYPATATFANGQIWVMNAKTNELLDSNAVPSSKFAIQRAVLKPLPR